MKYLFILLSLFITNSSLASFCATTPMKCSCENRNADWLVIIAHYTDPLTGQHSKTQFPGTRSRNCADQIRSNPHCGRAAANEQVNFCRPAPMDCTAQQANSNWARVTGRYLNAIADTVESVELMEGHGTARDFIADLRRQGLCR